MQVSVFHLDAFAARLFTGNPAAVVVLDDFLEDRLLQSVAAENNLSETAFLAPAGTDYRIRWFTPAVEVSFCGHATLAAAAVIMERLAPARTRVVLHSARGPLQVERRGLHYVMDLPIWPSEPVQPPADLCETLGIVPLEVVADAAVYLARLEDAQAVQHLTPALAAMLKLDREAVIVTAPGNAPYDFISRFFAPAIGIPEDPVTGGAHCMLTPFWAGRLKKTELRAFQASRRGGELICRMSEGRVQLAGACVFFSEGQAQI